MDTNVVDGKQRVECNQTASVKIWKVKLLEVEQEGLNVNRFHPWGTTDI